MVPQAHGGASSPGETPWLAHAALPAGRPLCRRSWSIFFLLGCGILAPWNALITSVDYWGQVFPGQHVDRLLTICYVSDSLLHRVRW